MFVLFVKVNCVVMRGLNEEEIVDFVALTENKVNRKTMHTRECGMMECDCRNCSTDT